MRRFELVVDWMYPRFHRVSDLCILDCLTKWLRMIMAIVRWLVLVREVSSTILFGVINCPGDEHVLINVRKSPTLWKEIMERKDV